MLRNSRNRYTGKVKTTKYLLELLGEKPDNQFIEWLSPQISFTDVNEFHTFMEWAKQDPKDYFQPQGRCRITPKQAQLINDFWKEHCIISVDRRNDRNHVRIKPTKLHPLVRDLIDDNVEHTEKNKLQAQWWVISTITSRMIHQKNNFLIDEQVTAKLREQLRRGHKIRLQKDLLYCIQPIW